MEHRLKRCFVISPIGLPDSGKREHVDDVFDYIITPAVKELGYEVMRADHDTPPGMITEQMYDCILEDELLIAILTFDNPNVYYEIAVAEAAARPLILLTDQSHIIPFDIKDRRVLNYDMRPRALIEGTHVGPLKAAIRELEASAKPRQVPFRPSLSPLGATTGAEQILRRSEDLPAAARIQLVHTATDQIVLQGMALFGMAKIDAFPEALMKAMARKVKIRILLQDPQNLALEHQLRLFSSKYVEQVREEVRVGVEFWKKFASRAVVRKCDGARVRRQPSGVMFGHLILSETTAFYTPYSPARPTGETPTIITTSESVIHESLLSDFDFIWNNASE